MDWETFKREHPPGTRVRGKVTHVANFGVFVDIDAPDSYHALLEVIGFEDPRPRERSQYPSVGELIEATVIGYGDEQHQVNLTQRPEDPGS